MKVAQFIFVLTIMLLIAALGFALGYSQVKTRTLVVHEIEYVPVEKIVKTLRVERVIEFLPQYLNEYREFDSQEALGHWQAETLKGEVVGWNCVDYAQDKQLRALQEGYLVSIQYTDTDFDGIIDHAICSTWIGDECIFFEPFNTTNWVGGVRDNENVIE